MRIAGLSRANKKDIERCYEAVQHAPLNRIHTFLASSDIHLEHKLNITRAECVKISSEMVAPPCKVPPALLQDSAPSAHLVPPGAQAASAHPSAQPEPLEACRGPGSPLQAAPKLRIFHLQRPGGLRAQPLRQHRVLARGARAPPRRRRRHRHDHLPPPRTPPRHPPPATRHPTSACDRTPAVRTRSFWSSCAARSSRRARRPSTCPTRSGTPVAVQTRGRGSGGWPGPRRDANTAPLQRASRRTD